MAERIGEMQTKSAPDSFGIIGENIRTQDNRITSDPMFCVYQKREIVVDADYDYDRIVWVKDGREYLFHESAVKVDLNRPVTGSLLKRIRNGKKAKS